MEYKCKNSKDIIYKNKEDLEITYSQALNSINSNIQQAIKILNLILDYEPSNENFCNKTSNPNDFQFCKVHNTLGECYFSIEKYFLAHVEFEKAINIESDNIIYMNNLKLANFKMCRNKNKEAFEHLYEQAITSKEYNIQEAIKLLNFILDNEHSEEKETDYKTTQKRNVSSGFNNFQFSKVYNALGECYLSIYNYYLAQSEFEKALNLEPENIVYANNLKLVDSKRVRHKNIVQNSKQYSLDEIRNNKSNVKQTEEELSEDFKIELKTCSKSDLKRLKILDDEKINKIISYRDRGIYYYDMDSFAAEFKLQPHEILEIEDHLIFPLKPKAKKGRRIDF